MCVRTASSSSSAVGTSTSTLPANEDSGTAPVVPPDTPLSDLLTPPDSAPLDGDNNVSPPVSEDGDDNWVESSLYSSEEDRYDSSPSSCDAPLPDPEPPPSPNPAVGSGAAPTSVRGDRSLSVFRGDIDGMERFVRWMQTLARMTPQPLLPPPPTLVADGTGRRAAPPRTERGTWSPPATPPRQQKPVFALAKVLHVSTKKREVLLAHLPPTPSEDDSRGQAFKFSVGQSSWREDLAALIHPIDVVYEPDNRLYRLRTTPSEIHAAFQAGRDGRKRRRDGP